MDSALGPPVAAAGSYRLLGSSHEGSQEPRGSLRGSLREGGGEILRRLWSLRTSGSVGPGNRIRYSFSHDEELAADLAEFRFGSARNLERPQEEQSAGCTSSSVLCQSFGASSMASIADEGVRPVPGRPPQAAKAHGSAHAAAGSGGHDGPSMCLLDERRKAARARRSLFDVGEDLPSEGSGVVVAASRFVSRQTTPVKLREQLQSTRWYQSTCAARLRTVLEGHAFGLVMVVLLLTALFAPDLCVFLGVGSSCEVDVILTLVMAVFAMEVVALSLTDSAYFLSFFQLMDAVGTVSMALDISFMLGVDASEPRRKSAHEHFTVLRVQRAAKVGFRAGRLARVLRLVRFLRPSGGGGAHPEGDHRNQGIATVISERLSNLLTTRVAALTIFLMMVLPLFEILDYPQDDFSLQTWVERISATLEEGSSERVARELSKMAEFFGRHNYGPYEACAGHAVHGVDFVCDRALGGWSARIGEPPRGASALLVSSETAMVSFNMHEPLRTDAGLSMAHRVFIVGIMVFSGLALSSVITELAVRPLEHMLLTVRSIASTVFASAGEEWLEEDSEMDTRSEMILLEQVVDKLATIAALHCVDPEEQLPDTADLQDEEVGILNMLHGGQSRPTRKVPVRHATAERVRAAQPPLRLEDFGVPQELYESWAFDTLALTPGQRVAAASFAVLRFHDPGEGFFQTQEEENTLRRFVKAAEAMHPANPFHGFAHAADVVCGVSRLLRLTASHGFLSELEQYGLLIAAVGHDLGHPGVNNGFLLETSHELALQYNDRSPLENMHCAKLYSIVANRETNVFESLSREQYREARKNCIGSILHTDMMNHQAMVKQLQMSYEMSSDVFIGRGIKTELDLFSEPETKTLIIDTILHSADVSNPCRTWEVTQAWADKCLEEFFAQGDQEKALGIPVQFLNDREKLNRPNSQIGFIEFMIAPFFAAQIRLWPRLCELGDNLAHNICCWEDLWVQEGSPHWDEQRKVRARVEKVKESLLSAAAPPETDTALLLGSQPLPGPVAGIPAPRANRLSGRVSIRPTQKAARRPS